MITSRLASWRRCNRPAYWASAVLCDGDIDSGAALSIEQFDSLIAELMVVRSIPISRRKHAARFLCYVYKRMRKPGSHFVENERGAGEFSKDGKKAGAGRRFQNHVDGGDRGSDAGDVCQSNRR